MNFLDLIWVHFRKVPVHLLNILLVVVPLLITHIAIWFLEEAVYKRVVAAWALLEALITVIDINPNRLI